MLLVHRLQAGELPSGVQLFHADFWVQVYSLLVGLMSTSMGKQIENFVSLFLDYDTNNDVGLWREYMHIRVRIDVRLPLIRWKMIRMAGGECSIVNFKYDDLAYFVSFAV